VFVHNGYGTMSELSCGTLHDGAQRVRVDVVAPGGWRWDVAVSVDGEPRGSLDGLVMLGAMAPFCGIDVGIDRRSPVSWERYLRHGANRYTGTLVAATWTPGDRAPDAGTNFVELLREMGRKFE
jgi:arylsulfatase